MQWQQNEKGKVEQRTKMAWHRYQILESQVNKMTSKQGDPQAASLPKILTVHSKASFAYQVICPSPPVSI